MFYFLIHLGRIIKQDDRVWASNIFLLLKTTLTALWSLALHISTRVNDPTLPSVSHQHSHDTYMTHSIVLRIIPSIPCLSSPTRWTTSYTARPNTSLTSSKLMLHFMHPVLMILKCVVLPSIMYLPTTMSQHSCEVSSNPLLHSHTERSSTLPRLHAFEK